MMCTEVVEEGIGKLKEQYRDALVASVQVMYLYSYFCVCICICAGPGKVAEHGRDALGSVQAV